MRIYIIMCVAFLISSCASKDEKTAAGTGQDSTKTASNTITFNAEQIKNGNIETGKVPTHLLNSSIHVNGQVDVPPENLLAVNVPMGGFLKQTKMLPGMVVRKGEVVALIENAEYVTLQQDYLTASSRIIFLKQELERQKTLSDQQASPLKLYQQSFADYNTELAKAAGAAQKLKMLGFNPQTISTKNITALATIKSPIDGFVSKVNVSTGTYVNPTDILMELVNTSDIHAALTVFEKDISKIQMGNLVTISLPSLPGKTFPGKVILIGKMLDSTRSVMVHCHFLKTDSELLPNMFLQAEIETKPQNTMALPDGALVRFGGERYVFLAQAEKNKVKFSMLPVKVGIRENGWNEIEFNKPELKNSNFVLKGAFSILSAMKNSGE
ncbi:MAG: efflux RND transporter periplasmic adaptor subunit [Pedobacter sp.]|nr:efflux RND transporter periplasmic adaptor subunit [Pedobacter sp.]